MNFEEVLSLAKQLISCPSITPLDAGCMQIIGDQLQAAGFQCESMVFDDVTNLWATKGKGSPLVVFAGHIDVVPPGPLPDWSYPPFEPVQQEGFLIGRGASDMKSAIAAAVIASKAFVHDYPDFTGTLAFLLTSDEEGEAMNGTRRVIEVLTQRGIKIDYCIIGEPSSEKFVGDQIRVGRRGSLHGKLLLHGKQGHVAHPHLARNPIHLSMLALHELTEKKWDQGNESFPPTTFQITMIQGGAGAKNIIPGHLEILFNFRFSTAVTIQQLKDETHAILNKTGLKYDIEWTIGGYPFLTQKGKLINATKKAINDITGQDTQLSTGGGTSDGRFIAPTEAELVELGVAHLSAHQVNEYAKISDIEQLAAIYYKLFTYLFD